MTGKSQVTCVASTSPHLPKQLDGSSVRLRLRLIPTSPRCMPPRAFDTHCRLTFVPRGQFSAFSYLHPLLVLTSSARSFLPSPHVCWGRIEWLVRLCLPGFSCLSLRGLFQASCLWLPTLLTLACEVEPTLCWKVDCTKHASPILSTLTLKSVSWHRK